MHTARLTVLFLVLLFLGAARPAPAGELSSEEQKWVRECLKRLDANSPAVRASAESALVRMGPDILAAVVRGLPQIKGGTARRALDRVLLGLGRDRVVKALIRMKEASGRGSAKRIDELIESLGGALAPGSESTAALKEVTDLDWRAIPFGAEHAVKDVIPSALCPGGNRVLIEDRKLRVDSNGDGKTDAVVKAGEPARLVVKRLGETSPRPVLFYAKLGRWYAASGALLRAVVGKERIEFLDADLDGDYMGAADYVRWNDGAFIRHHASHLIQTERLLATYDIRVSDLERTLVLVPEALPSMSSAQRRAMREVNVYRNNSGLAPLRFDSKRSAACTLHCRYLVSNSSAGKDSDATRGGAAHHSDPSLPGHTPEGAAAGSSSALHGGELRRSIAGFAATMLHRLHLLSTADETLGLGQFRRGKNAWSALWSGSGSAADVGTPLPVPAPGARRVPLRGSGEWPRPDAPASFYKRARGYPISVTLSPYAFKNVEIKLFEEDGVVPVAGHVWTPAKPIAKTHGANGGAAFFMPSAPLARGAGYWAVFTATRNGKPVRYAWTFRTD